MRGVSLIAVATALALSFSAPTFAQSAAGTAGAAVESTTQAGGTVSAGGTSVTVDAGADVDADASAVLEGDANGDGTISAEEQAAIDASVDAELDTDGDGTVSDAERAAGNTAATAGSTDDDSEGVCPAPEYTGSADISAEDMAVLEAATTAQFIIVDDCDDGGSLVSDGGENATDLEAMISANATLTAEIAGRGIGEIIGVSIDGDAVTIYAESNEGDDDTDDATSAGTASEGAATTGAAVDGSAGATVQSQ